MAQHEACSRVPGAPCGGPRNLGVGLREANALFFGARGGTIQRGVLSLRTSEFWRPVPGDLEAKNLDSLEDYTLVAKNLSPQQPGGPTRGPADLENYKYAYLPAFLYNLSLIHI